MKNSIKRAQSQACLGFAERKNFRSLAKHLKKLSLTLLLLITAAAGAWADETDPAVTIDEAKTTASFTMPASDVTVNYILARDLEDQTNKVTFSGLPANDTIIVKKGSDEKYQPAATLSLQLIDPLEPADAQNIIANGGLTINVLKAEPVVVSGEVIPNLWQLDVENPIALDAFLADMQPGKYCLRAEPKDENSPYVGTVTSKAFTVVEQYDLTVKPADEYSKGKVESVTVGTEQPITPDANTGEATKTSIAPNTDVKLKAKHGYIIEKVEVNTKKTGGLK